MILEKRRKSKDSIKIRLPSKWKEKAARVRREINCLSLSPHFTGQETKAQ